MECRQKKRREEKKKHGDQGLRNEGAAVLGRPGPVS